MGLKRVSKVVRVVRKIDRAMAAKRGKTNFQECMAGKKVGSGDKESRIAAFTANAKACKGITGKVNKK